MSWRLVEGVPLPDAVGGHSALDFCNTRAGWGTEKPKEYLTSPAVLALWARENGLLIAADAEGAPDGDRQEQGALVRALALRELVLREPRFRAAGLRARPRLAVAFFVVRRRVRGRAFGAAAAGAGAPLRTAPTTFFAAEPTAPAAVPTADPTAPAAVPTAEPTAPATVPAVWAAVVAAVVTPDLIAPSVP